MTTYRRPDGEVLPDSRELLLGRDGHAVVVKEVNGVEQQRQADDPVQAVNCGDRGHGEMIKSSCESRAGRDLVVISFPGDTETPD